jgi:hypothetical protein
MRFELTIRGLCVIAMKSRDKKADPRPKNPERVDILVPAVTNHKCALVWDPNDVDPNVEPTLIVNTQGDRLGSLDLNRQSKERDAENATLELRFRTNTNPGFDVAWRPAEASPNTSEDLYMDLVPNIEELGFPAIPIPPFGTEALGERARISLPFGKIVAADIAKVPGTDQNLIWKFANGSEHAVANKVLYVADDVGGYEFLKADGIPLISLEAEGPLVVKMCISNDEVKVPKDFTAGIEELNDLRDLAVLLPEGRRPRIFTPPKTIDSRRTGNRICTQVVDVWDDATK